MRKIEAPKSIEPWRIVCASTSEPDYSEERYILISEAERKEDYFSTDGYILLTGGHCSCYDWPDVNWSAVAYTGDEITKLAQENAVNGYDLAEKRFWKMTLMALGCDV